MAIDSGPLGQLVAEFMEDIERDYGDEAALVDAVVAIEVSTTKPDGDRLSTVEARILSKRNTVGIGIVTRTLHAMTHDLADED